MTETVCNHIHTEPKQTLWSITFGWVWMLVLVFCMHKISTNTQAFAWHSEWVKIVVWVEFFDIHTFKKGTYRRRSQTVTQQRVRLSYVFILDFDNASLGMRVLFLLCSVLYSFLRTSHSQTIAGVLCCTHADTAVNGAHDFSLTIFCVSNFVV